MSIKSIAHKGLEQFLKTGNTKGIVADHAKRIRDRASALNSMNSLDVLEGRWRFHVLKGDRAGQCAINVSGNYRMFFEFKDGDVYLLDYGDYH